MRDRNFKVAFHPLKDNSPMVGKLSIYERDILNFNFAQNLRTEGRDDVITDEYAAPAMRFRMVDFTESRSILE